MGKYQRVEEASQTHQSDSLLHLWAGGAGREDGLAALPHGEGDDSPPLEKNVHECVCISDILNLICSLDKIFRFTNEELEQTSL